MIFSASMLYQILKPVITISLNAYFKKIDLIGAEHLEHDGAIYVCNHPSALFDPIVVASRAKKSIFFLAGAEWFGSGLQSWLFKNEMNMIPVFRPWLAKDKKEAEVSNDEMFRACYESLSVGKRIIIFPEASSVTVPWVREIKTGTVRIMLGAEEFIQQEKKVKIIPIGLNYTNSHRFQTRVVMNVGDPIDFSDLESKSWSDDKEKVVAMTERVRERMTDLLYYPDDLEQFEFIKDVKKLMTGVLKSELGVAEGDVVEEFRIRKQIVREINEISARKPDDVKVVATELRSYIETFEATGFRQYNPFEETAVFAFLKAIGLVVSIPLFLIGTIFNLTPFLLSQGIYKRFFRGKVTKKDAQGQLNSAFAGSLGFASGLVVFLLWYILLWSIGSQFIPVWLAFVFSIVLGYSCGRFAMLWYKWMIQTGKYIRWQLLVISKPELIRSLLETRSRLIRTLIKLRQT